MSMTAAVRLSGSHAASPTLGLTRGEVMLVEEPRLGT